MGSVSSPLSCGVFLPPPFLQAFPLLVFGHVPPFLPSLASLFIYSFVSDFPSPLQCSGHPTPFAMCLLCYCLLFSFFSSFFPGWSSVCPGVYADLAQGCLWEHCIPLSSPCGLHLPKPSGHCSLVVVWKASWFLCLM
jgi:hypothetical protein